MWLPLTWPLLGTWPTNQTCALTGNWNWTRDPLVGRPNGAQSTEPHQPGCLYFLTSSPLNPFSPIPPPYGNHQNVLCGQILCLFFFAYFFKIFYLFIFRERGREGEREGEKHQCVVASHMAPTGEPACNPGMCPDWELNWRPLGSQPTLTPLSYTREGAYFVF